MKRCLMEVRLCRLPFSHDVLRTRVFQRTIIVMYTLSMVFRRSCVCLNADQYQYKGRLGRVNLQISVSSYHRPLPSLQIRQHPSHSHILRPPQFVRNMLFDPCFPPNSSIRLLGPSRDARYCTANVSLHTSQFETTIELAVSLLH